jgi:hypothetical protein
MCRDAGDTIDLTKAQLVVYELDWKRLVGQLAAALGIARSGAAECWDRGVLHVGRFTSPAGTRYECVLTFPLDSDDVHVTSSRLIADGHAPFLLLAPDAAVGSTRGRVGAETALQRLRPARRGDGRTPSGSDSVGQPAGGVHRADDGCGRRHLPGGSGGRNVFRLEGGVWTLTYAGRTVRLKDCLGLKYVARLIESKGREIDAAAL